MAVMDEVGKNRVCGKLAQRREGDYWEREKQQFRAWWDLPTVDFSLPLPDPSLSAPASSGNSSHGSAQPFGSLVLSLFLQDTEVLIQIQIIVKSPGKYIKGHSLELQQCLDHIPSQCTCNALRVVN